MKFSKFALVIVFRKITGMSPMEYRGKYNKEGVKPNPFMTVISR